MHLPGFVQSGLMNRREVFTTKTRSKNNWDDKSKKKTSNLSDFCQDFARMIADVVKLISSQVLIHKQLCRTRAAPPLIDTVATLAEKLALRGQLSSLYCQTVATLAEKLVLRGQLSSLYCQTKTRLQYWPPSDQTKNSFRKESKRCTLLCLPYLHITMLGYWMNRVFRKWFYLKWRIIITLCFYRV